MMAAVGAVRLFCGPVPPEAPEAGFEDIAVLAVAPWIARWGLEVPLCEPPTKRRRPLSPWRLL